MRAETLYTWFHARCRLPAEGIWGLWAVGEEGDLRLGIPEPCGREAELRRRFSKRMTAPAGSLLRGELRPVAAEAAEVWKPVESTCWRTPWLREKLLESADALMCGADGQRVLAIPCAERDPFPLPQLFCFADFRQIAGKRYAVFLFDREENPLFPEESMQRKRRS